MIIMKTLKIVIPSDDKTITALAEYVATTFTASSWQTRIVEVKSANAANQQFGSTGTTLSFAWDYAPIANEKVVFWLTKSLPMGASLQQLQQRQVLNRHPVFATNLLAYRALQGVLRQVNILPPPPLKMRQTVPGPYSNSVVVDIEKADADTVQTLIGDLLNAFVGRTVQLHLHGITDDLFQNIEKQCRGRSVQAVKLEGESKLQGAMSNCLAYITLGLAGDALEIKAELAACLMRPIVIIDPTHAAPPDFFADKATGFYLNSTKKVQTLFTLLITGKLEVARIGENAMRLLFERRNSGKILLEQYQ